MSFTLINDGFNFFIALGGAAMMCIIITILSLLCRVSLSKSLEGGLRMAIALTGMGSVISLLTDAFAPALQAFVHSTGMSLTITDLGWAPLALITWGSIYTLYFAFICIITNIVLLVTKSVKTLNVDLFNIWNISIIGLVFNHYSGNNIVMTSIFVIGIYTCMLFNGDALKPSINHVLHYKKSNITTTTHPSLLISPLIYVCNKIIDICCPWLDRYDFDAQSLSDKIGFWGSKFAIGAYLGIFIGVLGQQDLKNIFTLAFVGGVALELFSIVGGWFGPAIEPLSDGISTMMKNRFKGRELYIAIDWPILASRAELWAVANILAPILLIIALFLPGNKVLPLGGIILTVLTPALLVITRGKVIRMTVIGTILIPLFLWAATAIAPFITSASAAMGNIPKGMAAGQLFSSVDSNPIEKLLAICTGTAVKTLSLPYVTGSIVLLILYVLLFVWYIKSLRKESK